MSAELKTILSDVKQYNANVIKLNDIRVLSLFSLWHALSVTIFTLKSPYILTAHVSQRQFPFSTTTNSHSQEMVCLSFLLPILFGDHYFCIYVAVSSKSSFTLPDYLYDPRRANNLGRDEVEKCSICSDPPDDHHQATFIKPLDYPDVAREAIPMTTLYSRDGSQTLPRKPHHDLVIANPKYSSNDNLYRSPDLGHRASPMGTLSRSKDDSKMRLISPDIRNHKKIPVTFRTFNGPMDDGRYSPGPVRDPREPRAQSSSDSRGYNLYAY